MKAGYHTAPGQSYGGPTGVKQCMLFLNSDVFVHDCTVNNSDLICVSFQLPLLLVLLLLFSHSLKFCIILWSRSLGEI